MVNCHRVRIGQPPLLITMGVKLSKEQGNQMISTHLDWLRYTMKFPDNTLEERALAMARYPHPLFDYTGEIFTPGQGYNRGRNLNAGSITWHAENRIQGIGVMHTGSQLQELRLAQVDELELLRWIDKRGGKVSTMDACINVHNQQANPLDIIKERDEGTLRTRAKMIGLYSGSAKVGDKWVPGDTVYIGSAKSAVQVTVYNKAAEQKIDGDWIRIEITWRGKHAVAAHQAMVASGIGAVTRAAIQHQVGVSSAWWHYAMQGPLAMPETVKKPISGRQKWLLDCVLSALESEIDAERLENSDTVYTHFAALIDRKRPMSS